MLLPRECPPATKPPGRAARKGPRTSSTASTTALPGGRLDLHVHDDPYDDTPECVAESPNESPSDFAISGGLAHEHSQSLTDPEFNAWYNEKKEGRRDRRQMPLGEPRKGTRPAARDRARRGALQPADQRPRVPLPAGVEQRTRRLRATRGTPPDGQETGPEEGAGGRRHPRHDRRHRLRRDGHGLLRRNPGTDVKVAGPTSLTVPSPAGKRRSRPSRSTPKAGRARREKDQFKYKPAKKPKKLAGRAGNRQKIGAEPAAH